MLCFHSLIMRIYIYIESSSSCKDVAILCPHTSTVAQNMDLLRDFVIFTLTSPVISG